MLEKLNRKRKNACLLSLIITIIIIILVIIVVGFSYKNFLFAVLGAFLLIIGLYFLSKLIVIPKYNKVKEEIINYSIKIKDCDVATNYSKSFSTPISVYFDLSKMSYTNPIKFKINNIETQVEDFIIKDKINSKKEQIIFKGKILQINNIDLFSKDTLAFPSSFHETKEFELKTREHFKNAILKSVTTYNGKYITNNENKNDLYVIANIFEKIDNFHLLIYKNNNLYILVKEKNNPFEFNLQNEITLDTIEMSKKCYKQFNDIINALKENKNEIFTREN